MVVGTKSSAYIEKAYCHSNGTNPFKLSGNSTKYNKARKQALQYHLPRQYPPNSSAESPVRPSSPSVSLTWVLQEHLRRLLPSSGEPRTWLLTRVYVQKDL